MATERLKVVLLIVSTTAVKDPSTDASSDVLREVLDEEGGGKWEVAETVIVGDVITQIQGQIVSWADAFDGPNLIVTTGGTGFAVSDSTPEACTLIIPPRGAVQPLLHKQAPGLVHGMMSASLTVTPFAMMSRPVAGVRNKSVIVTLPGSPKGARENLQAVLKTLPHACLQAAGVNSRALHSGGVKKLEAESGISGSGEKPKGHSHGGGHGCGHHHHHGGGGGAHGHGALVRYTKGDDNPLSSDPVRGATRRHRKSPFPIISVEAALKHIQDKTPTPVVETVKVEPSLVGAVIAADVSSNENVPAFRASIVDGYAVVVPEDGNMKGTFPVVSVSHAAPGEEGPELNPGEVARITTGAPLPLGATSVIMVEDTLLGETTEDGMEEKTVEILAENVTKGQNIREIGSDVKQGTTILRAGDIISSVGGEIGLLTSVGIAKVHVYSRPIVGVLSTGDELVEADTPSPLKYGQVRDTNRPSLIAAARSAGFETLDLGIAVDKADKLEETLRGALRRVDLLITTGGVSMGELDLLKPTIERNLGGSIHFGRVAMKPGKPTTFAIVPIKDVVSSGESARKDRVVFSLPGNPASALVTFQLFVLPSLHHMSGVKPAGCSRQVVLLTEDISRDPQRTEYHRAVIEYDDSAGIFKARSTGGQRSSTVGSMRKANAFLEVPPGDNILKKDTKVIALLVGGL
ncbi:gephyrin [Zalerion maritima]|uniref:Gephyrin n=1 Tax=Zalerion maritima TaxID=339359 RepID=A0AAD5RY04_9PEZI|nr:gephyrin [Zalerion maritima]